MKSKKLILLEKILCFMAKAVLVRQKPRIIGITGSVGKTSAKTAIFAVLSSRFRVRENQKNYNNEIGIPLTIIGAESGGKNVFKWIWVFAKWIFALLNPRYPDVLVLELGVDRPGDMSYFMSFIKPSVGIVTNISSSHIEYFKTVENIAKEKGILIESLPADGCALLNGDDKQAVLMSQRTKAQVTTFGQGEDSTISSSGMIYNYEENIPTGISFKLNYDGKNIPIRLKNILAPHQIYAALAAAGVGITFKMNLVEIASALESLRSPVGRMKLIEGMRNSFIIDDTYNASPVSTVAALDVLGQLKSTRKIAVLGDMLELGSLSQAGHKEVARKIFSTEVDIFIAVGSRMKDAVDELISSGFPKANIFHFDEPGQAGEKIAEIANEGDFILVKGSQGMRMEKVVEKLLRNRDDENLLCRQSREWKKKPFTCP